MTRQTVFRLSFGAAVLSLMLASTSFSVWADDEQDKARALQKQGEILPLDQIIDTAVSLKAGKLLETEFEHKHERYIYEIEILDDNGQVWEMEFDARSGELINMENED